MQSFDKDVTDIYKKYLAGRDYNGKLHPNYYESNDKNERFLNGDQWYKVDNKNNPTPQLNIFKRVFGFIIAYLVSSKTTIRYAANGTSSKQTKEQITMTKKALEQLQRLVKQHWDDSDLDQLLSETLYKAVTSGDMAAYVAWEDDETHPLGGYMNTVSIDGGNVMFGNPNDRRVNHNGKPVQPYILLVGRETVENLKEEAMKYGADEMEIKKIVRDDDTEYTSGDRGKIELEASTDITDKATFIIELKPDKEMGGRIAATKAVKSAIIRPKWDTMMKIYPVAWSNWDTRSNSYHGQSPMNGYIPNQIFINKALAIMMISMMNTATPKVVFDKTRINNWDNSPNKAIACNGDTTGAVFTVQINQMASSIVDIINIVIKNTIEALGGNEVVLGNVNPENKSAIVQVTNQASIPFENQRRNMYSFVKQLAYIYLEYIKNFYKDLPIDVTFTDKMGNATTEQLALGPILDKEVKPLIDIGPSTYYSEENTLLTMDKLLQYQVVDALTYLESLPDNSMVNQTEIIENMRQKKAEMEAMQNQQMQMQQQAQAKEMQYSQMMEFVKTLPANERAKISRMGDKSDEYVKMLMAKSVEA